MRILLAISLSFAVAFLCRWLQAKTGLPFTPVLVFGSAILAPIDAMRCGINHPRHNLPKSPLMLAICIAMTWIIAFPWYLTVRFRVRGAAL